ncbi:hypothetical protein KJ671_02240 [Patescibacteria group bacterium]|nr:hypothetical protein [Patescibacteria group bacterium]
MIDLIEQLKKEINKIFNEITSELINEPTFLFQEEDLRCYFYHKLLNKLKLKNKIEVHSEVKNKDLVIYKKGTFTKFPTKGHELVHIEFKHLCGSNWETNVTRDKGMIKPKSNILKRQLKKSKAKLRYAVLFECFKLDPDKIDNRNKQFKKQFENKDIIPIYLPQTKNLTKKQKMNLKKKLKNPTSQQSKP